MIEFVGVFIMGKVVNKGLKLLILPDEDMIHVLEQNMGNARFIWNNLLSMYMEAYMLFSFYDCPLYPNISNFNAMLNMLKQENHFFYVKENPPVNNKFIVIWLMPSINFLKKDQGIHDSNPKRTLNNLLEYRKAAIILE